MLSRSITMARFLFCHYYMMIFSTLNFVQGGLTERTICNFGDDKKFKYDRSNNACVYCKLQRWSFDYPYEICLCAGIYIPNCPCEMIGLREGRCVSDCGPNLYIQYGKCVSTCQPDLFITNKNVCVQQCPYGTFTSSKQPQMCQLCNKECDGCFGSSAHECYKCKNLQMGSLCVEKCSHGTIPYHDKCVQRKMCLGFLYNNTCIDSCPKSTFFKSGIPRECIPCHEECNGCFGRGNTKCVKCKHMNATNICVSRCPVNMPVIYHNSCFKKCPGITYKGICQSSCPSGLFQFISNCFKECPTDAPFTKGQECVSDCGQHLLYKDRCVKLCPGLFVHYNRTCRYQCPPDYSMVDPVTKQCNKNCYYLTFSGKCILKCPQYLLKYEKTCIQQCPNNTYILGAQCLAKCPSNTYISSGRCLSSCPQTAPNVFDGKCVGKCPSNFALQTPEIIYGSEELPECVKLCPNTYFGTKKQVMQRINGILLCKDKCSDDHPYILPENRLCVEKCPPKTFPYKDDDPFSKMHIQCKNPSKVNSFNLYSFNLGYIPYIAGGVCLILDIIIVSSLVVCWKAYSRKTKLITYDQISQMINAQDIIM